MILAVLMTLTAMIIFTAEGSAQILASVSCPSPIYQFEVFGCQLLLYNADLAPHIVSYSAGFDRGAKVLSQASGDVNVPGGTTSHVDFNCWATAVGTSAFAVRFGVGNSEQQAIATSVSVIPAPLRISETSVDVYAGQRNDVVLHLVGNGAYVKVRAVLPQGMIGKTEFSVGDVDGDAPLVISLSPNPWDIGDRELVLYISYADSRGYHLERQVVTLHIRPNTSLLLVAGAAILLVVAVYLLRRRGSAAGGSES